MYVAIETGADARIAGADPISGNDLGIRFSGFRGLERFEAQVDQINFGHISWPGGALAEASPGRFGLDYPGLVSPESGMADLTEVMAFAVENGASLSIVLPTVRYVDDIDQLRADVAQFMSDLLGGVYGPLPDNMFLHIGSEHYAHFSNSTPDGAAGDYGRVAAAMVEEINAALENPEINPEGIDIGVAVQAGRSLPEDEIIRDSFTDEQLAEIDLVTHHRYASQADGIDSMLRQFRPINEAWQADVSAAGGDEPQINLGEWNVASITRNEALTRYIRDMAEQGVTVHRSDVDLEGRTDDEFEQYWQRLVDTRDYGAAQPQLYLEMFSEYVAEGLGAASIHAADLMHAGRITFTDAEGNPVQFIGAEMIDMLYESVEGTSVLEVSESNRAGSPIATYAFESDDRLVVFVAADEGVVLGDVTLDIEGLDDGYTAIWTDSLVAEVPEDWMEQHGIPDNPNVDESNEGQTYALGVRGDTEATISGDQMTINMAHPGEVVRIIVARTPEEAAAIAEWAGEPDYTPGNLPEMPDEDDDLGSPVIPVVPAPGSGTPTDPMVPGGVDFWAREDGFRFTRPTAPSAGGGSSGGNTPSNPGQIRPYDWREHFLSRDSQVEPVGSVHGLPDDELQVTKPVYLGPIFKAEDWQIEAGAAPVEGATADAQTEPDAAAGDDLALLTSDATNAPAEAEGEEDPDADAGETEKSLFSNMSSYVNALSTLGIGGFLAALAQHSF